MAELQGTKVISQVVPPTTEDTFPTHDAIYGKGGWREVATIEERNNISRKRLREGMVVYVQETKTDYKLKSLGENKDGDIWEELVYSNKELISKVQEMEEKIKQISIPITTDIKSYVIDSPNRIPQVKIISDEGYFYDVVVIKKNATTYKCQWNIIVKGVLIIR